MRIDLKNCTIKLKDGGSNSLTIKVGDGNLEFTERQNRDYLLDKGLIDEIRNGDQVPVDVRLNFTWEYLKGSTGSGIPSPVDVLKQRGEAAAWVSSDSDACRPFAVDIEVVHTPVCVSGDKETILLSDFRHEELSYDIKGSSIAVTGKCNISEATITREAQ